MEYGINIKFFSRTFGMEAAARMVSRAGFTQLDYNPTLSQETWQSQMKDDLRIFRDYGLTVHQTHCPFNRYGICGDRHALLMARCAEATEYMGAQYMVVHGDEFDFEHMEYSPEAALTYNHGLFLPYVERAERNSYKVAFETVFEDNIKRNGQIRPRFTSAADDLLALIRSFDSESAVCCWDFGHAHVSFRAKAPEQIRAFGSLIQCTHLHDNAGNDSHQLPMTGDINWPLTIQAFRDIGYGGVLSVEYAHGSLPEHLAQPFINLSYQTAEHLWTL